MGDAPMASVHPHLCSSPFKGEEHRNGSLLWRGGWDLSYPRLFRKDHLVLALLFKGTVGGLSEGTEGHWRDYTD